MVIRLDYISSKSESQLNFGENAVNIISLLSNLLMNFIFLFVLVIYNCDNNEKHLFSPKKPGSICICMYRYSVCIDTVRANNEKESNLNSVSFYKRKGVQGGRH